MTCPFCGNIEDRVVDSRESREGDSIRRRRQCIRCEKRFTTYERIDEVPYMVIKKDGRREKFDRTKVLNGLIQACQKRPISQKVIEDLVEKIVNNVTDRYERELPAEALGKQVMEGLREIDHVAYVRFASVYRRFQEATDFVQEVRKLEAKP